ncbi:hypothetical protein JXA02_05460 [candidate division KSB1 bacterium]|nr:hypothetical protein [candidate division KSB1 bacterium]RQW07995.1 MAG: hypothetical protein EH222_06250 [candidate division KSB1 bacterium]
MQFLAIFIIFTLFLLGFILSLKFSRYKQRAEQSSCCGGGHCATGADGTLHRSHAASQDNVCCRKK